MFINSIASGLTAAQVWLAATRTLTADPATDAGAGVQIWTASNRQPTTVSNLITTASVGKTSIANGTAVDFRPALNLHRCSNVIIDSSLMNIQLYDGTQFPGLNNSGDQQCQFNVQSGHGVGVRLNNGDASGHNYYHVFMETSTN